MLNFDNTRWTYTGNYEAARGMQVSGKRMLQDLREFMAFQNLFQLKRSVQLADGSVMTVERIGDIENVHIFAVGAPPPQRLIEEAIRPVFDQPVTELDKPSRDIDGILWALRKDNAFAIWLYRPSDIPGATWEKLYDFSARPAYTMNLFWPFGSELSPIPGKDVWVIEYTSGPAIYFGKLDISESDPTYTLLDTVNVVLYNLDNFRMLKNSPLYGTSGSGVLWTHSIDYKYYFWDGGSTADYSGFTQAPTPRVVQLMCQIDDTVYCEEQPDLAVAAPLEMEIHKYSSDSWATNYAEGFNPIGVWADGKQGWCPRYGAAGARMQLEGYVDSQYVGYQEYRLRELYNDPTFLHRFHASGTTQWRKFYGNLSWAAAGTPNAALITNTGTWYKDAFYGISGTLVYRWNEADGGTTVDNIDPIIDDGWSLSITGRGCVIDTV